MIDIDEEALICDLAETYHIYDYRQLPASKVAVYSCGLNDNSRIKKKLNNQVVSFETMILASISDRLAVLMWRQTKDGSKGINKPASIIESIYGTTPKDKESVSFYSGEDFEKARHELIGGA